MANSLKLRGIHDLLVIVAVTALLSICIVFVPSDILRVILGLPSVLLFPGYALVAALFPRKGHLSNVERVALSIGLSMAVVSLTGLVLNYLWEVSLYPILVSIAGFTVLMCAAAYYRRAQLPQQERHEPHIGFELPRWKQQSRMDRVLTVILVIMALGAAASGIYVVANPKTGERFTEFYLLGSDGTAQYLPHEIVLGTDADVTVGIINHEGENVTYQVRVILDGIEVFIADGIALEDGETWEETLTLTPTKPGDSQKAEFLLYREGESEPYHKLRLWIDVREPSASE
jgi:uncharacterized membrane protein